jgi:hypothetical protein
MALIAKNLQKPMGLGQEMLDAASAKVHAASAR